jgi:hypothetical protein
LNHNSEQQRIATQSRREQNHKKVRGGEHVRRISDTSIPLNGLDQERIKTFTALLSFSEKSVKLGILLAASLGGADGVASIGTVDRVDSKEIYNL